jgi:hypothetical protein
VTGALLDEYGNSQVDYDDVDEDELIGELSMQLLSAAAHLNLSVTPHTLEALPGTLSTCYLSHCRLSPAARLTYTSKT